MSALSTSFKNKILDHIFGRTSYAPPANITVSLLKSLPADDALPSDLIKADYTGYADITVANNPTNFPAASSGTKTTGTIIYFPEATGGNCTVTHMAFVDAENNILIAKGVLTTPRTYEAGVMPRIAPGDVVLTLL